MPFWASYYLEMHCFGLANPFRHEVGKISYAVCILVCSPPLLLVVTLGLLRSEVAGILVDLFRTFLGDHVFDRKTNLVSSATVWL